MDVRGVGSTPGAFPVRTANGVPSGREITSQKPVSPQDQLEISAAGKMLDQLSQSNPNFQPLIVHYRQQRTIESMRKAGARVLAIEAGKTILLDEAETLALADRYGITVVAVDAAVAARAA